MEVQQQQQQTHFNPNKTEENLPWVQKYRPHQLKQLISHADILKTLNTFVRDNNVPNLLFYGPPGTGKTSTIVALARELYQKDYGSMVLELNASDQRGIDVVREQIKTFVSNRTFLKNKNLKLVILDEVDMMTKTAQFALRRVIEKSHANARFCLISNYVSRIIPALQSRCTRFKFKQVSLEECKGRIMEIAEKEKLNVSDCAIDAIFKLSEGDMRRVVNTLQSLSLIEQDTQINSDKVYEYTGNPAPKLLENILDKLFTLSIAQCLYDVENILKSNGIALESIIKEIYQMLIIREMPGEQKAFVIDRIGDVEYRLSVGCQERACLTALIGAFSEIRQIK